MTRKFLLTALIAISPAIYSTTAYAQTVRGAPAIASYHSLGRCLDVRSTDRNVLLWDCHGGSNQAFRFVSGNYGQISLGNQLCLTSGTANGGVLTAQTCNNATNQRWGFQSNGTLRNEIGMCADIEGGGKHSGARILGWTCSGSSNQQWYPAITGSSAYVGISATAAIGSQSAKSYLSSPNFSGGNIVAGGAGNIVAGGAGNLIANDGASIVAGGAGNIIAASGSKIVAGGAGNIVAGGAGNFNPSNWNFFSGNSSGAIGQ